MVSPLFCGVSCISCDTGLRLYVCRAVPVIIACLGVISLFTFFGAYPALGGRIAVTSAGLIWRRCDFIVHFSASQASGVGGELGVGRGR